MCLGMGLFVSIPLYSSLTFFNLDVHFLFSNLGNVQPFFQKYSLLFFLSSSWIPLKCVLTHLIVSPKSLRLFFFFTFFILSFWLDHFKWLVFKFADSFLWLIVFFNPSSEFSIHSLYSSAPEFQFSSFLQFLFVDILRLVHASFSWFYLVVCILLHFIEFP